MAMLMSTNDDNNDEWRMTSLIMIDDDEDDAKRHWKSVDVLMTVWPLPLMTLPIDGDYLSLKCSCWYRIMTLKFMSFYLGVHQFW